MNSQEDMVETDKRAEKSPRNKRMSVRQKKKLILAVSVFAIAVAIIFWGWSSTGNNAYLNVGTLVDNADNGGNSEYIGDTIEIRGTVTNWTGNLTFELADFEDPNKTIDIVMHGAIPEGFEHGKSVVVIGELRDSPPLTVDATGITVGCASKY